jgi:arylsulfatase A-like enzyme
MENRTRRDFLKIIGAAAVSVLPGKDLFAAKDKRPNVILFIGDDIGWNDFGCYGHRTIRTPNVDKMAAEGLRFTNAFLTASSCSPSRCSIVTGRYPHNTGAAELHTPLPMNQVTFPKLLKDSGYYTAQAGKWHLGGPAKAPTGGAADAFDRTGGDKADGGGHGGEDRFVEWLAERPKDKPFFMWFAPHDAHRAWDNNTVGKPYTIDEVVVPSFMADTKETRQDLASYYNEITRFDHYIGEVYKELDRQGVSDNTMVMVMADNGRPFPGCKTRVYDRGMQTALVTKWPKGINKKGAVCRSLVSSIDIAATILELAGIKVPSTVQGISFAKMLNDPNAQTRKYVFSEHNWHDYESYERQVRTKEFMYVRNERSQFANQGPADSVASPSHKALQKLRDAGKLNDAQKDMFLAPRPIEELFDVVKDPLQFNNLINDKKYKDELKQLRKVLAQWQEETCDTVPAHISGDTFDRETGKRLKNPPKPGTMPGSGRGAGETTNPGPR